MPFPAVRLAWLVARSNLQAWMVDQLLGLFQEDVADLSIRRLQVIHRYKAASPLADEDVMVTTHDFINTTDGDFDDTWITSDFTAVESRMDTFWGSLNGIRDNDIVIDQYRWYRLAPPFGPTGPPVRVVAKNILPSSTVEPLPRQVAITVTERTALRRHWGRFYIPGFVTTSLTSQGRVTSAVCTTLANAAEVMYEGIMADAAGITPVVFSRTLQAAFNVTEIQVDDLFDIQRRRRLSTPLIRERRPLTA